MNDRERQNSKTNKSGGGKGILIVAGFIILMNIISAGGGEAILGIFVIVLIIGTVVFFLRWKKAARKKAEDQATVRWSAPIPERRQNRAVPAERPAYTPQPVYNENTSGENFQRDRQRRLAQLDSFLKNGIIDREEYKVLRSRYERDI